MLNKWDRRDNKKRRRKNFRRDNRVSVELADKLSYRERKLPRKKRA
jgi:hypothetical protein